MIAPEYFNNHIAVEGEIIVKRVPNDTGSVVVWNSTTKKLSTRTHAEIVSDLNLMTRDTAQDVIGTKNFINSSGNSGLYDNRLHIKGTNGSKAGISFWSDDVGQLNYYNTAFHFKNQFDNAYQSVKALSFVKDGSDDNSVLLGGGGQAALSDFATKEQLNKKITAYKQLPYLPNLSIENKWLFFKIQGGTGIGMQRSYERLDENNLIFQGIVPEDQHLVTGDNGDNYTGLLRTVLYSSIDKTISLTFTHDDGCAVYINGIKVYESGGYRSGAPLSFDIKVGYTTIDFIWDEGGGGDGIMDINPTIGSQVEKIYLPQFLNSNDFVGNKIINGSYDANNLSNNSITYGYSVLNSPASASSHSFTILNLDTANPNFKMQIGFDGDTNEMFSRIKSGGSWNSWSKYITSSQLTNFVTTDTNQLISGLKAFITGGGNYGPTNNALQIYADDGSLPSMTYSKGGSHVGQIMFDSDGFYFKNGDNNAFYNVKAGGFEKNNSNNSYVLLGGGDHKPISDFALSSDLSNAVTTNTAQTITADKVFKKITTTDWIIPKYLAFPDASGALPNYIGFYMWNSQWQVNWRDPSNNHLYQLLDIDGLSKNATFYGNTVSPKFVTSGGNSDQWNEAYNSLSKKEDDWYHSARDFPQGTLIKTDVDYSQTYGDQFLLEMKGNMYGGGNPLIANIQGYIYYDTIIAKSGYSTLYYWNSIIALNLNGKLCFWFPSLSYWQGFDVKVTIGYGGVNQGKNRVLSVSDSADPGGSKRVEIALEHLLTKEKLISGNTFWEKKNIANYWALDSDKDVAVLNGSSAQRLFSGGLLASDIYSDSQYIPSYGIHAKGSIQSDEGFVNRYYKVNQRNKIWNFGDSTAWGLSYFQGNYHSLGEGISFHFGDAADYKFFVKDNGSIYTKNDITAGNFFNGKGLYSPVLSGGQVIHAGNNNELYFGNPVVPSIYIESGNSDLLHNRAGNVGRIWDAHNFNPNNYIPTSHSVYNITQNEVNGWRQYVGYLDNRNIQPAHLGTQKLQIGFTNWFNNGDQAGHYADYLHFGGYQDGSGGNQNLIMFSKNGFGLRQYHGSWQGVSKYQSYVDYWNTGNFTQNDVEGWKNLVSSYSKAVRHTGQQTGNLVNYIPTENFTANIGFTPYNYQQKLSSDLNSANIHPDMYQGMIISGNDPINVHNFGIFIDQQSQLFVTGGSYDQFAWKKVWTEKHFSQEDIDSWNNIVNNSVTTNTVQHITSRKFFDTYGSNWGDNSLIVYAINPVNPAMTFYKEGISIGQLGFDGGGFHFVGNDWNSYFPIKTNGFIKNGLDDNSLLLAGGGHKAISYFATSNQVDDKVNKSGDTMTGSLSFANNLGGISGTMGDNDFYRIMGRTNGSDNGYLEIATADGATEPIHIRQYHGLFTDLARTATLLDENGNTSFPGTVYSQGFVKANSDNSLLLLGGGGHKAISDFVLSSQLGDYVTTDTAQKIDSTKTIGFQNTIYSGWDRSSVDNPQMGPFSLLNLALQGAYPLNGDDEFKNGNNNIIVYNNYSNGTVTMTREAAFDLPNRSGIQLRFNYNGNGATPGLGGFILGFNARPNAIFIQKFTAKLPVGYAFNNAENYMGNNASVNWLTSRAGTGKWETYVRAVICGTGTNFGNGGHVYVEGPDTAMEFYLAFAEIYEVNSSVFSRIKESFYAKNEAIDFTNNLDQLMKVGELSWAQRTVLERGWNSTYGDYIQLKTPGSTTNSAALLMSQAGNIYTTGGLYSSSNLVGGQIFNGGGNILYIGNGALPYINFESTNRFHFSINGSYRYWFDNNEFVSYGDLNLASSDNDLRDIIWTGPGGVEKHRIYEGSFSETLGYRKNGGTTYALLHSGNYSTYITGYQPSSEAFKNLRYTSNVENVSESGIYRQENPLSGYNYTTTLNLNSSDGRQQLTIERSGGGMKFRGSAFGSGDQGWSDWKTVLTKEDLQSITGLKSFDRVQGNFGSGWNLTTNKEVYGVLLEMGQGSTPGDNYGTGIGFHNATSGGVQASIIVKNNGVDGTHMAFATTQSYAAGPQVGMTLSNNGVVDFPRTLPTFQGSVLSTQAWVNETVTNYIPNYSNWSGSTYINQRKVVGELAWKNYGNGHTIFDISSGTTPWGVSKSNVDAEIPWQNSFPTLVGGNGSNTYGVRVDSARIADKVNGYDLSTFSTQTWVNTNFIPKTHPVFNITQNNINTWNNNVMPGNYVTTDTMQIISGPKEFVGSILASGGISSINGNSAEVFVGNSNTASLKDEIVNDESDYSIRLDPHHYEIDSSGNLDVDDRNRLIHIIGEEVKMSVNFKEIYPKQQIVIYNFDQKGDGMQVLIKGKNVYNIEPGCFLRLYVTKSLRVIAERQQPCEFIW